MLFQIERIKLESYNNYTTIVFSYIIKDLIYLILKVFFW